MDYQKIADCITQDISGEWQAEVYRALARGVMYCCGMGVNGDIAEFGTMTGKSAIAISVALALMNKKYHGDDRGGKKAWFFDSFRGLPPARFDVDKLSPHVMKGVWAEGTCKGLSAKQFESLIMQILPRQYFEVREGFFSETVPAIDHAQKFAMLHIDGDLYESAIDVLDTLFARNQVSAGALVLFDDWNCNGASPSFGERRAWSELIAKYNIDFSDEGAYSHASHKFIIHEYTPNRI